MRNLLILLISIQSALAFRYIEEKVVIGESKVKPSSGAILQVESSQGGFLGPRLTPTQRDAIASPVNGVMVYNSTLDQYEYWDGSAWTGIGSGGSGSGIAQWTISTGYATGDVVYATGDKIYVSGTVHTSDSTTFATDFALGYWTLLSEGIKSSGDLVTDNSIIRYDGTGGEDAQGSNVIIDDSDAISGITQLSVDNIDIDGNSITSTDTNGNIILNPDGTGQVNLPDLTIDRLTYIDSSGNLTTTDYSTIIQGTDNQVVVTDNGSTVTLSTPQDIASTSDVTFNQVTVSGLNPSEYVITDGSSILSTTATIASSDITGVLSVNNGGTGIDGSTTANGSLLIGNGSGYEANTLQGTVNQVGITNGVGTITITASQDISTVSTPEFAGVYSTDAIRVSGISPPSAPASGSYLLYPKTDGKWYKQNSTGDETTIENRSLFIFHQQDYEGSLDSSSFTTGNNNTFENGGTLDGSISNKTSDPLSGLKSLTYTQGSSSVNDWISSNTITLDAEQKGTSLGVSFPYVYDGADDDIKFVVYDVTNSQVLTSTSDLIKATSTPKIFSLGVDTYSSTDQIRYGFQTLSSTNGAILEWDDVEFSTNPYVFKNIANHDGPYSYTPTFVGLGTCTSINFFYRRDGKYISVWGQFISGTPTADVAYISLPSGLTINTSELPPVSSYPLIVGQGGTDVSSTGGNDFNMLMTGSTTAIGMSLTNNTGSGALSADLGSFFSANGRVFSVNFKVPVTEWEDTTEHVITPASESTTTEKYLSADSTSGTGDMSDLTFTGLEIGKWYLITGQVEYETTGTISLTFRSASSGSGDVYGKNKLGISGGGTVLSTFPVAQMFQATSTTLYVNKDTHSAGTVYGNSSTSETYLQLTNVTRQFLAAIPDKKVTYLKHVETAGTHAGGFTAGSYVTRTLNTIEGDTNYVSLASNQFTLQPGKYKISAVAATYSVTYNQTALYNVTDSTYEIYGTQGNDDVGNDSHLATNIEISTPKTYELRHRCTTTISTYGLGRAANYGNDEVYAIVTIEKIR